MAPGLSGGGLEHPCPGTQRPGPKKRGESRQTACDPQTVFPLKVRALSLTGIKGGQERREAAAQHASRRRSMGRTQLRRAAPILFPFPIAHWGPGPVTKPGHPHRRNERHMRPQNFDTPRGGSRDRRRSACAGDTPLIEVQRAITRSHELLLRVGLEEGPGTVAKAPGRTPIRR